MALHDAARSGDAEAISRLIGGVRLPAKVNARDRHSRTPLHLAAWANQAEAIKLLCSHGAEVNATAMDDMSALHFAAQKGHLDACKALIGCGAKVGSKNRKGLTALHLVAVASGPKAPPQEQQQKAVQSSNGDHGTGDSNWETGDRGAAAAVSSEAGSEDLKNATAAATGSAEVDEASPASDLERGCCDIARLLVRKAPDLLQSRTKKGETAEDLARSPALKVLLCKLASSLHEAKGAGEGSAVAEAAEGDGEDERKASAAVHDDGEDDKNEEECIQKSADPENDATVNAPVALQFEDEGCEGEDTEDGGAEGTKRSQTQFRKRSGTTKTNRRRSKSRK